MRRCAEGDDGVRKWVEVTFVAAFGVMLWAFDGWVSSATSGASSARKV